jgi:hypothetical protein
VVVDANGEGHAVLTLLTDRGDLVLDNKTNDILPWHRTGYVFVKRESQLAEAVPGRATIPSQRFAVVTGEVTPPSDTQAMASWLSRLTLLAEAGLPRRAMRMTVVVDANGEGHAVLTLLTDRGDLVLDPGSIDRLRASGPCRSSAAPPYSPGG